MFSVPLNDAAAEEGLLLENLSDLYEDVHLVTLTGWTLEYIRNLGYLDREAILQIDDSMKAAKAAKARLK